MFYIKRLIITANGKKSKIAFEPGVNIIYGPSNTGKSMVLDCIDYIMGAKDHSFDKCLSVERIQVVIIVNGKRLSIGRNIDCQEFDVISDVEEIESGKYKIKGGKKCPAVNDVWLKLMGIPIGTKILQTQEGKTQWLTIRTFYHTFIIDEDRVHNKSSILKGKGGIGGVVSTAVLTALLYLATGNNFLTKDVFSDPKIKKAKNESALSIINKSMSFLEHQRASFEDDKSISNPEELRKRIDQTINEIGAAKGVLKNFLQESSMIGMQINELIRQIAEDDVLMNRNQRLLSQYKSDIKRLAFIVDGNIVFQDAKELPKCPFCNGELPHECENDFIEAAIAEEKKVELQIRDLKTVQNTLKDEYVELEKKKEELVLYREELEEKIRGELKPKLQKLHRQLEEYKDALKSHEMGIMIQKFSDFLHNERLAVENEEDTNIQLNVKEKFGEVFKNLLEIELDDLLKQCSYRQYISSYFNMDLYDVVVNGHEKKSQGKGFRAFLNTILCVAIENCLDKMGNYHPSLFVVDSPILSLMEKRGDKEIFISGPMKKRLFEYFVSRKCSSQVIIIENEIPSIDYKNANLIQFTKDQDVGRYGLIEGYQD